MVQNKLKKDTTKKYIPNKFKPQGNYKHFPRIVSKDQFYKALQTDMALRNEFLEFIKVNRHKRLSEPQYRRLFIKYTNAFSKIIRATQPTTPLVFESTYKDEMEYLHLSQYRFKPDPRYYGYFEYSSKRPHHTYKIKFATNNIFCHVYNSLGQTRHPAKCFGDYKIKVSKKNKHRRVKELMQLYSDEIISRKHRKMALTAHMNFKLSVKQRLRGRIVKWLKGMVIKKILYGPKRGRYHQYKKKKKLEETNKSNKLERIFTFDFGPQKAFNGCRGKIVRRKKRLYPHFRKRYL